MDDAELRKRLNPEQYRVMREKGEERPWSGRYWDHDERGVYLCAACGQKLFSSKSKFDSGTGFASFRAPIDPKSIVVNGGEASCANCGSHVGHVVQDGEPYYRIKSVALHFKERRGFAAIAGERIKDQAEGWMEDQAQQIQGPGSSFSWKNIAFLIGAGVLGMGIGAGATSVYSALTCQSGAAANQSAAVASTTPTSSMNVPRPAPTVTTTPKKPPASGGARPTSTAPSSTAAAGTAAGAGNAAGATGTASTSSASNSGNAASSSTGIP